MVRIQDIDNCECNGCNKKAVSIVFSRDRNKVIACCSEHTDEVIDEGRPEYHDQCPNCECLIGIN